MQSWSPAPVPVVPGRGPELRLYDSSDRQVRPMASGRTATMYVCGITPYDATHLGHAAMYLAFDLVHRVWLDAGHEVHYVLTKSADLKFICSRVKFCRTWDSTKYVDIPGWRRVH